MATKSAKIDTAKLMAELGFSGNAPQKGLVITGEYLAKLKGLIGFKVYDEMRRNEPIIKSVLRASSLPILQNSYSVEPPTDLPVDKEIAEFVERNIFKEMTNTWQYTLEQIMLMSPFGFSILEKVYRYDEKVQKTKIKKLDPRLPSSIHSWVYDENAKRLNGVTQRNPKTDKEVFLPIEKLLVFSNQREGDNWVGISDLRAVYGNWFIKQTLQKIDAIKHDRYGVGVPVGMTPEGVDIDEENDGYKYMVAALEAFSSQEASFIMLPNGYKLEIQGGQAKAGTDVVSSMRYHDEKMAVAFLAQFLLLGQTDSGSRALGESFIKFFQMALQERADYIAEVLTRFLIRELVDCNWVVDDYPTLIAGRIKDLPFETIATLTTAGVITKEENLENTVRRALGIVEVEEDESADSGANKGKNKDPDDSDVPGPEDDPDNGDGEDLHSHTKGSFLQQARVVGRDGKPTTYTLELRREPSVEEGVVNFAEIDFALDQEEAATTKNLIDIKNTQVQRLSQQISGGKSVQNLTVPGEKDQFDILWKSFKNMHKLGKKQSQEEIVKQRPDLANLAGPVPTEEFFSIIREELSLDVERLSNRLKTSMTQRALNLRKSGWTTAAITSDLQAYGLALSEVPYASSSTAAASNGIAIGRRDGVESFDTDEIAGMYRSGLLDKKMCTICAQKDQMPHEIGDPEMMAPDSECIGYPNCRCINIAVMKSEEKVGV